MWPRVPKHIQFTSASRIVSRLSHDAWTGWCQGSAQTHNMPSCLLVHETSGIERQCCLGELWADWASRCLCVRVCFTCKKNVLPFSRGNSQCEAGMWLQISFSQKENYRSEKRASGRSTLDLEGFLRRDLILVPLFSSGSTVWELNGHIDHFKLLLRMWRVGLPHYLSLIYLTSPADDSKELAKAKFIKYFNWKSDSVLLSAPIKSMPADSGRHWHWFHKTLCPILLKQIFLFLFLLIVLLISVSGKRDETTSRFFFFFSAP